MAYSRAWLCVVLALLCLAGCADRKRRNPLDPSAEQPEDTALFLQALAGDGQVVLRWDFSHFEDVSGYALYRRRAGGDFVALGGAPLPATTEELIDREVENGVLYEYRLALVIEGEGETLLGEIRRATPGGQAGWVADRSSGLVWRISPDNRSAQFFQGRFPGLQALAVDRLTGAAWVSDRFFSGLFQIGAQGELGEIAADLEQPGAVSIDAEARLGWVVDQRRAEVYLFALETARDSLALEVVDAHFVEPSQLAARDGICWIVDRGGRRIMRYEPSLATRAEWTDLERPLIVAAAAGNSGWALVADGGTLMRLTDESSQVVALPFERGLALQVDRNSDNCWVLGREEVAIFDAGGGLLGQWQLPQNGRALALDETRGDAWVGTEGGQLLKFDLAGVLLARLGGFATPYTVVVDPGRP